MVSKWLRKRQTCSCFRGPVTSGLLCLCCLYYYCYTSIYILSFLPLLTVKRHPIENQPSYMCGDTTLPQIPQHIPVWNKAGNETQYLCSTKDATSVASGGLHDGRGGASCARSEGWCWRHTWLVESQQTSRRFRLCNTQVPTPVLSLMIGSNWPLCCL